MHKIIILITSICFTISLNSSAQITKQKAEATFVNELNHILKNTKQQHWKYNGLMTVDAAFTINKDGILSVTVRYTDEAGNFIKIKMEAPVNKINYVAYDLYLLLDFTTNEVTIYESEVNSDLLVVQNKTNYFHLGIPAGDGFYEQEQLQKMLDHVKKYY